MAMLPTLPATRAALFGGFLAQLHAREREAREQRHDAAEVPAFDAWLAVLVQVAEALRRSTTADTGELDTNADGATTALPRARWPATLTVP